MKYKVSFEIESKDKVESTLNIQMGLAHMEILGKKFKIKEVKKDNSKKYDKVLKLKKDIEAFRLKDSFKVSDEALADKIIASGDLTQVLNKPNSSTKNISPKKLDVIMAILEEMEKRPSEEEEEAFYRDLKEAEAIRAKSSKSQGYIASLLEAIRKN